MLKYTISSSMVIVISSLFVIGIGLFMFSFVRTKSMVRRHRVIRDTTALISKLEKSKIMTLIINSQSKQNKKTLHKLKTINSKLTLQRILSWKVLIFIICLIGSILIRINFADIIKTNIISPKSLYDKTSFRVNESKSSVLLDIIDTSYVEYIVSVDNEGFLLHLKEISEQNGLDLLDEDLQIIINEYKEMYTLTHIDSMQIWGLILFALFATAAMDFYITARYNIRRADMLKEFEKLEIIAILLMAREELNVLDMIKEMDSQSKFLKPYFTKCLRLYPTSAVKAINVLIDEVADKDFRNFMIVIRSCLDSSKKTNREMLKIQRELRIVLEQTNLNVKNRKKTTYLTIAQFPLLMVLSLNLIIPGVSNMNFNM